jgi:TetR/AcrR family transcriptional regulator, cholesterol catabolism regulator
VDGAPHQHESALLFIGSFIISSVDQKSSERSIFFFCAAAPSAILPQVGEDVVQSAAATPWADSVSMEALCARIAERHGNVIRIQKDRVVVANLARIIEATLKLSNKKGFHATSLRDLAEASGLSMGGLYAYMDSKTTLLSMILQEMVATVVRILGDAPEEMRGDPHVHLHWFVDTHVRLSEAMLPWFVFAFMEAKFFPPAERQFAVDSEVATEKIIADILARGRQSGAFTLRDAPLAAALVKPLLQDWYLKRAKYRKRGTSIDGYITAVTSFIDASLGVKPGRLMRPAAKVTTVRRRAALSR